MSLAREIRVLHMVQNPLRGRGLLTPGPIMCGQSLWIMCELDRLRESNLVPDPSSQLFSKAGLYMWATVTWVVHYDERRDTCDELRPRPYIRVKYRGYRIL